MICNQGNFEDIMRMWFDAWIRFGHEAKKLIPDTFKTHLERHFRIDLGSCPLGKHSLLMAAGIVEIFGLDAYPLAKSLIPTQLLLKQSDCTLYWLGLKHIAGRMALTIQRDSDQPMPSIPITKHTMALSREFEHWWRNLPITSGALP